MSAQKKIKVSPATPAPSNKEIDRAIAEIKTKFGDEAIMKLGDAPKVDVNAIPTGSIGVDWALGIGGLPRGRVVEIFGPESSGKTTLTLHVIAEAQKRGGICAFVDAEHALDPEYAKKVGVKIEDLLVAQPDTGEQGLEIVESLVRSGKIDVVVIDSVAALTPKDEIEGDMGAQHVGKHARLMSQALRKLTAIVAKTKTVVIFINQIRMQIGVMFGCLNYKSKVTLADGTQEWIGKIVNRKMNVAVMSYDWRKQKLVPAKVTGWYENGNADSFLQITAYDPSGSGVAHVSCTPNHPILTPTGWRKAENLKTGDHVLVSAARRLNDLQREIIRGSLLGDGNLSRTRLKESLGVRFRLGHGLRQKKYLLWKTEFLKNIPHSTFETKKAVFSDFTPLVELHPMRTSMYRDKHKYLSPEFLAAITPLSLAIWYQDDGCLTIRNKAGSKGRIGICVQAIASESRVELQRLLKDRFDIEARLHLVGARKQATLSFDQRNTEKFVQLIRFYVHPSMRYKMLPQYRRPLAVSPSFSEPIRVALNVPIVKIGVKPKTRSMRRFDIRVRGHHNFLADNVIVHNSPETTTGGKALKFYTSVRIDIRRIAQIKKGDEVMGGRHRVKIVKNKVAAPFRQVEFDMLYGEGISREGEALALGEKYGIVSKSSSGSYEYLSAQAGGEQKLGRGYDAARTFLHENKSTLNQLLKDIRAKLQ